MQSRAQQSSAESISSSTSNGGVLQTDPVQLSELLTRLSELQVKPHQQWLQGVLDTMQPRLHELSADQLSATLKVLGGWGLMPAEPFMQALHAAVTRQASSLTMRHIADMAWGLAQLQYPRQPFLDELLQAALDLMSSQHCRVSAITSQQYGGHSSTSQTHNECLLQQQGQPQPPVCCSGSLADLIWSVARLQHTPSHTWLSTFAGTSQAIMPTFTPHQLAQVIWAFARLPYQPGQVWMDNFLEVVRTKLRDFDSKSVSLTAWGLATLKVQPSMRWLFAFERQAERTLSTLAASELACTLWALSELKEKRADKLRLGRLVRRQEGGCCHMQGG